MARRVDLAVPGEEALERIASAQRPLGLRGARAAYALVRETYFDTKDGALRRKGIRLYMRLDAAGRHTLEVETSRTVTLQGVVDAVTLSTPAPGGELYRTLAGDSELATRIRETTDPVALRPFLALDIDRESRELKSGRFTRPNLLAHFDRVLAHRLDGTLFFQSVVVEEMGVGTGALEKLVQRLDEDHGLAPDGGDTLQRALAAFEASGAATSPPRERAQAVLVLRKQGAVALVEGPLGLRLPTSAGSGEDAARSFAEGMVGSSTPIPEAELVGFAPSRGQAADLEVWLMECPPGPGGPDAVFWFPLQELAERIGGPRLRDPSLVAALLLLIRSEVGQRLLWESAPRIAVPTRVPVTPRDGTADEPDPEDFLATELSILDFNHRVLELAEDPSVPLLERFRFLSIFASNMDEFFVVRVGRLKDTAARAGAASGTPPDRIEGPAAETLDIIAVRARALMARQAACLQQQLLPLLARAGVRLASWDALGTEARAALTRRFDAEIFPLLTPRAMAVSPGHPFPRMESLGLSLAAVLRGEDEGIVHLAHVPVPPGVPRFVPVPGGEDLIAVEDLIAAHAATLFPAFQVAEVHAFRVSRMGDVEIDEVASASLLASVEDGVEARPYKPVVRLEVQRTMPREVLAYLLRELRQEAGVESATLGRGDVFEVDGPLDLTGFAQLTTLPLDGALYPPFEARQPLPEGSCIFEAVRERDLLVYHPFESFDGSVGRLIREAATDPQVVAIKLTLYRTGKNSAFADTLLEALRHGKEVTVFVELKARFDEESNIQWTRRLIEAGGHVVYGVVGYKTHAKTALVIRREGDRVRRYVHIGTGNYNATTARFYTDLGLLSADPDLGADLNDFFNELTGSSGPPVKTYRRLLVAPNSLAQGLDALIRRETEHARAGRPARIQAKMNGLTDRRTVTALYEASRAGVQIDLVVRAVCTLRPGVPGLSENIRVRSILGRFLEHARVFYFANAGEGAYFLASADWRRRNLRKRVEVAVPVDDPAARARLRALLDAELNDPRAWVLRPDGACERQAGDGPTTQERALAGDL